MGRTNGKTIQDYYRIFFNKELFIIGLMLLGIGLPVSPFLVSFAQFYLMISWGLEGQFNKKWQRFKSDKALQLFLIVMVIHVLWLINTSDFKYAFHDLKIKLPLLFIPLVVATSYTINSYQLKQILLIFVATVVVGTFISMAVYLGFSNREITDIREISIFISHIRFGLMIVFSVFILGYYFYTEFSKLRMMQKIAYIIPIFWLIIFLFILQSVTSWVVLSVVSYVIIIRYYKRINHSIFKIISWVYIVSIPLLFTVLFGFVLLKFFNIEEVDYNTLPKQTELGNDYKHNKNSTFTENGNYVWLYYCNKELMAFWPQYSNVPYTGKDAKGQPLKYTLVRYLTSKNLTKDAEGLKGLDIDDIKMIEDGYASCIYKSKLTPYVKLYELVWELNQYYQYGNPNAKTISMRIEYAKAGFNILKDNILFGVGTGDVQLSFNEYYESISSPLEEKNRRRSHNQYLTFALTFGMIGFALLLYAFIRPAIINKANWTALSLVFIIIVAVSMLNEDTLETQSGVTFFAYFYSLLILRKPNND